MTSIRTRRDPFSVTTAKQLNPELAINPSAASFGTSNAVFSQTFRNYRTRVTGGPLSLKAVLHGTLSWQIDGRPYRVSESTYLLINSGQPYTIAYDEPATCTAFILLFRTGYLEEMAAAMRLTPDAMLDDPFRRARLDFPVALHAGPSAFLTGLRAFAVELCERHVTFDVWERRFHELGATLLRERRSCAPRPWRIQAIKPATRRELLRRVALGRDFLISMSDGPVTVGEAARAACISTFHFQRVFRQAFGLPPHAFLKHYRMHRASDLLRSTDMSVSEIARRVGFTSIGSFINAFVSTFGVAPLAHRFPHRRVACFHQER